MKTRNPQLDIVTSWRGWLMPAMAATAAIAVITAVSVFWAHRSADAAAERAALDRLHAAADTAESLLGEPETLDAEILTLTEQLGALTPPISVQRISAATPDLRPGPGQVQLTRPISDTGDLLRYTTRPQKSAAFSHATVPGGAGLLAVALAGVVCFRTARRTAVLRRIGSALADSAGQHPDPASLHIAPRFGPLAVSWNSLLEIAEDASGSGLVRQGDRREEVAGTSDVPAGALDAMPMGLLALDSTGRVILCNGATGAMLGVPRAEVLGADVRTVSGLDELGPTIETALRGERTSMSVEISSPDASSQGVIRATVRALRREDQATVLIVLEDVTQQRLAEDARNSFVAQATHELRAPLTNIRLSAEEAIDVGVDDPALLARSLNIVNAEARRLERVVQDMLSVSEIEAATMSLQIDDVPLSRLLTELERDYAAQAEEAGVTMRFTVPAKLEAIRADRDKLALLLHNVVGNALKYTPTGGSVEVQATQTEHDFVVAVTDTGPGIAPEDHEKIFQKFYRTDTARGSTVKGSGLGLALAREVARLHGGDITVESEPGRGSTFTVRVPSGEADSPTRAAA